MGLVEISAVDLDADGFEQSFVYGDVVVVVFEGLLKQNVGLVYVSLLFLQQAQ